MNATVFGKPYWEFLHGVAPHLATHPSKDALCTAWANQIGAMPKTVPCSACQGSIGGFVNEVTADTGKTPLEHARSGTAPWWTRIVHEKVEHKLARQRWAREAAPQIAAALEKNKSLLLPPVAIDADAEAFAEADAEIDMRASVLGALLQAGEACNVAELITKTPKLKVQELRRDLDAWTWSGKPFAMECVWNVVLIMAFFHEFVSAEDKTPLPLELAITFESFAVLSEPWYQEHAAHLRVLAQFVRERHDAFVIPLPHQTAALKADTRPGSERESQSVQGGLRSRSVQKAAAHAQTSPDVMEGAITDAMRSQRKAHRSKAKASEVSQSHARESMSIRGGLGTQAQPLLSRSRISMDALMTAEWPLEECSALRSDRPTLADLMHAAHTLKLFDAAVLCKLGVSLDEGVAGISGENRRKIEDARRVFRAMRASTCSPVTCA